jgi:hypothetical protein
VVVTLKVAFNSDNMPRVLNLIWFKIAIIGCSGCLILLGYEDVKAE